MPERFVVEMLPAATLALLGGSHARGTATASSDLDVVAIDPTAEWSYRQTAVTAAGIKVEQFVYRDLEVLVKWFARQVANRHATLFSLFAESIVLVDRDGIAAAVQADARSRMVAGPGPLPDDQRDVVRYHLTDLLDDLVHIDPGELPTLAAMAWRQDAEAICHVNDGWVGQGKWLRRYVHILDPAGAARLDAAYIAAVNGDRDQVVREFNSILDQLGGCLDVTDRMVAARSA